MSIVTFKFFKATFEANLNSFVPFIMLAPFANCHALKIWTIGQPFKFASFRPSGHVMCGGDQHVKSLAEQSSW